MIDTKAQRQAIAWAYAVCRERCDNRYWLTKTGTNQAKRSMNRLATMCGDNTIWVAKHVLPGCYTVQPAAKPET